MEGGSQANNNQSVIPISNNHLFSRMMNNIKNMINKMRAMT